MANKSWREYPANKPSKIDYYICTVKDENGKEYIMYLLYETSLDKWLDINRLKVFKDYEVYTTCDGPNGEKDVVLQKANPDNLCFREDVIAFKNSPKFYKK